MLENLEPVWTTQHYFGVKLYPYDPPDGHHELCSWDLQPMHMHYLDVHPFIEEHVSLVLNDGPWVILMTFTQETRDGALETYVYSSAHFAFVKMRLGHLDLTTLVYAATDGTYDVMPSHRLSKEMENVGLDRIIGRIVGTTNPIAVKQVRQWIRRRVLPEFEKAKVKVESANRTSRAHSEAMRKKYLP